MADNKARYTLRVDRKLLDKFKYIVDSEGRTANRDIELYIKIKVKKYEDQNEVITDSLLNGEK